MALLRAVLVAVAFAAPPSVSQATKPEEGRAMPVDSTRHNRRHGHNRQGEGWRLTRHSFSGTLTYDDTLGDWLSSAGTMALRDRLQLLPPVPGRYGLFWSKQAVRTSHFEVTFTLSVNSGPTFPKDAAVAFWVGLQDWAGSFNEQAIVTQSKDWKDGLNAAGLSFVGNRPNFTGLGVLLLDQDKAGAQRQSVTGLWGDGSREARLEEVVEGPGAKTSFVDWATGGTRVKVAVEEDGSVRGSILTLDALELLTNTVWSWMEDGVTASDLISFLPMGQVQVNSEAASGSWKVLPGLRVRLQRDGRPDATLRFEGSRLAVQEEPSKVPQASMAFASKVASRGGANAATAEERWQEVFRFPPKTFPQGQGQECFLGFSGWSGGTDFVEVNLHQLQVMNLDPRQIGEQGQDFLGAEGGEWLEVLEQEKRFLTQASQKEAVERLTRLLTKHVEQYDQLGERLKGSLVNMEARLDILGADISTYHALAQAFSMDANEFDPQVVMSHLGGIRSVLTKDQEAHDAKLTAVHQAAKDLKAKHGAGQLTDKGRQKVQAVTDQSRAVEEYAERGSKQTNGLLLVIVASVGCLGLLFLNRMRYYEKKHYI